jgi:hypothetical protein
VDSDVTNATGWYEFAGLTYDDYTVAEVLQAGWIQTYPAGNHTFTATSKFVDTDNDFGNFRNVNVTAWKFEDLDGDGDADVPIEGWEVHLTIDGAIVDTQYTNSSGGYTWTNLGPLPAGSYYDISETVPPGWTATSPTSYDFESPPQSGASYSGTFTNHEIVEFLKYFSDSGALNGFTAPTGPFPGTTSTITQIKTGPQVWWEVTYSVTNEDGEGHYYTLWDKWGGNLLILGGYPTAYTPANGNGKGAGWLTLNNAPAFKIDYNGYSNYLASYGVITANIDYAATHTTSPTDGAWMSMHTGDQQEGTNPGKGRGSNKDGNSYDIDIKWNIGWLEPGETATLTIYLAPGINPGGVLQFSSYNCYTVNTGPRVRAYETDQYLDNEFLYSWDWTTKLTVHVEPADLTSAGDPITTVSARASILLLFLPLALPRFNICSKLRKIVKSKIKKV